MPADCEDDQPLSDEEDVGADTIPAATALPIDVLTNSRCDTKSIEYADSKSITLETGEIGRLANGSIMLRAGDTMIYTNVCSDYEILESDFTPLQIVYHERLSAAGRTACAPSPTTLCCDWTCPTAPSVVVAQWVGDTEN